ncbi:MAG TPA: hypothetical protein VKT99_21065 [Xanthobacteraceae bacterium]|jgi:hypothetical protein|nr:hypothetical protein [Xanthobacteraceae bacterium]
MTLRRRDFLSAVTLTAALATPALGQAVAPTVAPVNSGKESAASTPDFSGMWVHGSIPGFEPLPSGPTSLVNRSRRSIARLLRDLAVDWQGPGEPPSQHGVGNLLELVGDYTNLILRPWAAEVVKKFGEMSLAGVGFPSPRNQCWPGGVPFVFTSGAIEILQQPDKIAILYAYDHQVRHVRLNQSHPSQVTPTWYGDSVGHYESDTLVIDTIGIKVGPFAAVDWYGTPHTEALHVVERYRLIDYEAAKDGWERDAKENWRAQPAPNYRGKYLQLHFTVDDEGAFTTPWAATMTYGRSRGDWAEAVCAENIQWYSGKDAAVPRADKPDF